MLLVIILGIFLKCAQTSGQIFNPSNTESPDIDYETDIDHLDQHKIVKNKVVHLVMNGRDSTNNLDEKVFKIETENSYCTCFNVGNFKDFNLILTAANCFKNDQGEIINTDLNPTNYKTDSFQLSYLSKSELNIKSFYNDFIHQVLIHPNYKITNQLKFDLALIVTNRILFNSTLTFNPFLNWKTMNQFYQVGYGKGSKSNKLQELEVNRDYIFEIDNQLVILDFEKNDTISRGCKGDSGSPLIADMSYVIGAYWGGSDCESKLKKGHSIYVDLQQNEWFKQKYVEFLIRNATIDELIKHVKQNLTEWFRDYGSLIDTFYSDKKLLFNLIKKYNYDESVDELLDTFVKYNLIEEKSLETSKALLEEMAKKVVSVDKLSKVVRNLRLNGDLTFVRKLGLNMNWYSIYAFNGLKFINMFNIYNIDGVVASLYRYDELKPWMNTSLNELGYSLHKLNQTYVITWMKTNESKSYPDVLL